MNNAGVKLIRSQARTANRTCVALTAVIALCTAAVILTVMINSEVRGGAPRQPVRPGPFTPANKPTPETTPQSTVPPQISATRIRVAMGEKQDLQVATGIDSSVIVSPEIASVEIKNRFTLTISPIKRGETILLVTYNERRQTYIIEVGARSAVSVPRNFTNESVQGKDLAVSGSFTTSYSQGFGDTSSVVRQNLDYRRKLGDDRTLRVGGEMFKLIGNSDTDLAFAHVQDFAFNRLSIGLDTGGRSIDILDSQLSISPMSLNNYTVRGFHLSSKPGSAASGNLAAKGLEVFAGFAKPSFGFFDTTGGKIAGVMVPVVTGDAFQVRAGVVAISPDRDRRQTRGGTIVQTDAAYAPTQEISAEAEAAYANGNLSWRGRLDLRYAKYGAFAEITRLDRGSPLNSIGAQPGGRSAEAMSFYWRPGRRFTTAIGYNHTEVNRLTNSLLVDLDRSLLFANAGYTINKRSRIHIRYTDQKIETAFPGSMSSFEIETRTLSMGNTQRFNPNWSNIVEARFNFNREAHAGQGLEKGFGLNEQLRYTRNGNALTGFLGYTHKSPSLTSLIVRSPQLLPPQLQVAFALDPAEFLRVYRDRLQFLLGGIELPQTRNLDAGIRFQKTFSRLTLMGETRYNAGEVFAVSQKALYTSLSAGVRFDNANSLQINGWKSFGRGSQRSSITVSYTHQFGSPGDGFQFSHLFNFDRGRVHGRVFYDLNGNGLCETGEPGVAGTKIQIDGKRTVITDSNGRYELAAGEGSHSVSLISDDLGVRLLASTPTEHRVGIEGGQKLELNFGVRNSGSISGRVFIDLGTGTANGPGIGGILLTLHSTDPGFESFVLEQVTASNGTYDFSNLRPGKYLIGIDPTSVPANFRIPAITDSSIVVEPLHGSHYDVSIAAQRAVAGTVFIDTDGDGRYTNGKDQPVEGASVSVNDRAAVTDATGAYILRNLPAGSITLMVTAQAGTAEKPFVVELGPEPVTQRACDLKIEPR